MEIQVDVTFYTLRERKDIILKIKQWYLPQIIVSKTSDGVYEECPQKPYQWRQDVFSVRVNVKTHRIYMWI